MQINQVTAPCSWLNCPGFVTCFRFINSVGEDFHCCSGFYTGLVLVLFYQVLHVNWEQQFGLGKEEGLEAPWACGRETKSKTIRDLYYFFFFFLYFQLYYCAYPRGISFSVRVFLYLSLALKHKKMWGKKPLASLAGSEWWMKMQLMCQSAHPGAVWVPVAAAGSVPLSEGAALALELLAAASHAGEQIGKAQGGWSTLTNLPRGKTEMHSWKHCLVCFPQADTVLDWPAGNFPPINTITFPNKTSSFDRNISL